MVTTATVATVVGMVVSMETAVRLDISLVGTRKHEVSIFHVEDERCVVHVLDAVVQHVLV